MKVLLVVNPVSGGIDKGPFIEEAEKLLTRYGIEYVIFETTGQGDNEKFHGHLDTFEPDRIGAVGGDGTFTFVIKNTLGERYHIGCVPMGSANGMSKELGVSQDPTEALRDLISSQKFVGLDVLQVNDNSLAIHMGDVGINANIVEAYDKEENRGMMTYAKHFIKELGNTKQFTGTVEINGKSESYDGLMFAICNGRKYGTGIPLNVKGSPHDGKFEIVILKKIDQHTLLNASLSKFDEGLFDPKNLEIIQATNAKISFENFHLLQLDGEVIGDVNEIKVTLLPAEISFITTANNPYIK